MRLKISARSSHLARLQAFQVGETIQKIFPGTEIDYFFRESLGDKNLTDPLWKMPEKGVFTEDFHKDLIDEKTDLVVHSWKDLPTERNLDTVICATLPRADQRDLLLFKKKSIPKISSKKSAQLLSSSQRRIYNLEKFLLRALPYAPEKIHFKDVRGNIPTRIEKLLAADDVDGLIVAKAALDRLLSIQHPDFYELQIRLRSALSQLEFMVLPLSENPNAAAQGALAIEVKKSRVDLMELASQINDAASFECVQRERDILSGYGGGCHQKIGIAVLPRIYGNIHFLKGLTDKNQILDVQNIHFSPTYRPPTLSQKKFNISSVKDMFERKEIEFKIPTSVNAFYVSRISGYRPVKGIVWAAGLETWKKLAAKNVWVNGCAESLGESEEPRIEILCGYPLSWAKLTHAEAESFKMPGIATYQLTLKLDLPDEALQAENFFWMSPYQFDMIMAKHPQLKNRTHCCGVGQTYQALQSRLASVGQRPYLFLNESHWRKHE